MSFRISALPRDSFAHLFHLSDAELAAQGALRRRADAKPGFPCRISLADAEIGEEVILAHFEHHSARTPFRASHAVYVRPHAVQARPAAGDVPALLRSRILSLRAFDAAGLMIDADLADGHALEPAVERMLGNVAVDYIHIHYAKPGCYAARIDRA
jgi:hypothetical protein